MLQHIYMHKKSSAHGWSWEPFGSYDTLEPLNFLQSLKKFWLFPSMSQMVSAMALYLAIKLVVPAVGQFQSSSNNGMRTAVTRWQSLESPRPAGADSSGDGHGCGVGCRQGELLVHGLWDGNLMSFSSTPVWDAKDALIVRAAWKFSSGTLLCWKMLILQNWSLSQEHVDSIESFNGKQAGRLSRKPVLLVACQPRLPRLPAPQAAAPAASWHPDQASASAVGWLGGRKHKVGGHWPLHNHFFPEEKVCFLDCSTSKVILTVLLSFCLHVS